MISFMSSFSRWRFPVEGHVAGSLSLEVAILSQALEQRTHGPEMFLEMPGDFLCGPPALCCRDVSEKPALFLDRIQRPAIILIGQDGRRDDLVCGKQFNGLRWLASKLLGLLGCRGRQMPRILIRASDDESCDHLADPGGGGTSGIDCGTA